MSGNVRFLEEMDLHEIKSKSLTYDPVIPDLNTVQYVFLHYSRLLNGKEAAASRHLTTMEKFGRQIKRDAALKKRLEEKGHLTSDAEVLDLIKDGFEAFRLNAVKRILNEQAEEIYFNNCPSCGKLARTPLAKQCRFCHFSWHDKVSATFQIFHTVEIKGRGFYVIGEQIAGKINIGMKADLVSIGIPKKPLISAIDLALHSEEFVSWEDVCLCLEGLSERDKESLNARKPFSTVIFIEK